MQTVQTNCRGEVGGGICKSVLHPLLITLLQNPPPTSPRSWFARFARRGWFALDTLPLKICALVCCRSLLIWVDTVYNSRKLLLLFYSFLPFTNGISMPLLGSTLGGGFCRSLGSSFWFSILFVLHLPKVMDSSNIFCLLSFFIDCAKLKIVPQGSAMWWQWLIPPPSQIISRSIFFLYA